MKSYSALLAMVIVLAVTTLALADAKSQLAREVAEAALRKFGRQAAREGTEALAMKIEAAAAKHGDEIFEAVRKVGPRALPLVEDAGVQGRQAAKLLARHGEPGAAWVVSRPAAMKLVAQHGEEAAAVLVKHAGIAEPVVEGFGAPAVKALAATGPQGGRRLAMLMADGDLAKIGRTPELMDVIAKYGDKAMEFVWKNKGALAVGTTLAAFLANPESFLNAGQGVTKAVAENVGRPLVESAVRPLAEVPAKVVDKTAEKMAEGVAKGTNWTAVILATIGAGVLLLVVKLGWLRRISPAQPTAAAPAVPPPVAVPPQIPAPGGAPPCP
jgi:hypothetical protein